MNVDTYLYTFFWACLVVTSCQGQADPSVPPKRVSEPPELIRLPPGEQIAQYVRNIHQDANGHFWMGTNGLGIAHYDGTSVQYYSVDQGFHGYQITGISEDKDGNIWFATDQGIVMYDGISSHEDGSKKFTNYTELPHLEGKRCWSVHADSKGHIWAGTATGVYQFDGHVWAAFDIPYPEEENGDFITPQTAWSIIEDSDGHMWFSTNGHGAFEYDGAHFIHYNKQDGLTDDSVDQILEDSNGNIWFATRFGGVSKFDGKKFTNFTQANSIGNNEVCVIMEDQDGHIWMSSEGYGVYKYDGTTFTNYGEDEGLKVRAVQTIFQDNEHRIWAGGGGGLYRLEGDRFIHVTQDGPW